jgi:HSP20 family molecular chaperone IbpA
MSRSLRLPDAADASDVDAEMADGVLTVKVKRAEHAQPKTVEIK